MFDARMSGWCMGTEAYRSTSTPTAKSKTSNTRTSEARYRIAWALIIACILVTLFVAWAAAYRISELINHSSEYTYATVVIQKGDTLWDIAVQYGPKGWDPRKTVQHIAEVNHISPQSYAQLQPGDRIDVPIPLNATPSHGDYHVMRASLELQSLSSE